MGCGECFEDCDLDHKRNFAASVASGFLFALAWWILIDAASRYTHDEFPPAYNTAGVFGTVAFILINLVPNSALSDDFGSGRARRQAAFFCLFFAFVMIFSCVVAACWILFGSYVAAGKTPIWPGVAILLQNILLCISSLIYRFGRKELDY
ncbi:putative membrane protein [Fasciola hepatica]|uniref:Membrane protein n=1 Tax=Fasciola hepatica TaxID=6192 RepID=A0A4E0RYE7_FASHE|nr:putative membrane protein [Fasciola hepatica]